MRQPVWIGVDGGGTSSTGVAVSGDGQVLAVSVTGGLNHLTIGLEEARSRLAELARVLLAEAGASEYEALCLGSAALDGCADAAATARFAGDLFPPERLVLCSDVRVARQGAALGGEGIAVVSGTGAMVYGIDRNGAEQVAGGWGYRLGDPGGGYGVAAEGLRAVFAAEEGVGPATPLREAALRRFRTDRVRGLIDALYDEQCAPADIAAFARDVAAAAAEEDPVARGILRSQYALLARQTAAVWDGCGGQVFLWGGMFAHSPLVRGLFQSLVREERPGVRFGEPALPPPLGAVLCAMQEKGALSEKVTEALVNSWKEREE